MRIDEDLKLDILAEAPCEEPARQYYFIDVCRRITEGTAKEKGRPLKCRINTFGCQMNARDSEKLQGIMEKIGYVSAENDEADFVLYNTCTVRENANERLYGRLGTLKRAKRENPDMIIAVCGCMMQEEEAVNRIRQSYPHVDIIFGTFNIYKLAELLFCYLCEGKNQQEVLKESLREVENLPAVRKYSFKSGLNIMYGCNNFCTYCIVPYVRGRERSRQREDILCEAERLSDDGVKEIMLLGQNVNSYEYDFPRLLDDVAGTEGIERVRFMTSHPKDLSDELIEVIAKNPKVAKHIHLPLQSGSSRILEKMNRHYTKESYLNLAKKIRGRIPDITITTDIIVGFPGESEEDFEDTLDVCREVKFDSAFTFIYSKRTGTEAAKMAGQVPKDVSASRMNRLLALCAENSRIQTEKRVGREEWALIESVNEKDSSLVTGRLSGNGMVHLEGGRELIGRMVKVRLDESKGFYYLGSLKGEV